MILKYQWVLRTYGKNLIHVISVMNENEMLEATTFNS
jgi:hypothetical protein